jgi:WhiB family redox-sensing transcriptional regulator
MTSRRHSSGVKAHNSRRSNADPVAAAVIAALDGDVLEPTDAELAELAAAEDGYDWRDDALCAQVDPELFFPEKGVPGDAAHGRAAKKICARCPVSVQCLEFALSMDGVIRIQGIWAGTNERARQRMKAERAAEAGQSRLPGRPQRIPEIAA